MLDGVPFLFVRLTSMHSGASGQNNLKTGVCTWGLPWKVLGSKNKIHSLGDSGWGQHIFSLCECVSYSMREGVHEQLIRKACGKGGVFIIEDYNFPRIE